MGVTPAGEPELRAALRTQTEDRIAQATELFRRARKAVPQVEIAFDLRGTSAGQFIWPTRQTPRIRYNLALAARHRDDFLRVTVAHEVAHLVTAVCHGRVAPHGAQWQAVMQWFGIDTPQRCHSYATEDLGRRRQRTWAYRCGCRSHRLSTTRHRRIVAGDRSYICRRCGAPLHPETEPAPATSD